MKLIIYIVLILMLLSKMIGILGSFPVLIQFNYLLPIAPEPFVFREKLTQDFFSLKPFITINNKKELPFANHFFFSACLTKQLMYELLYFQSIDYSDPIALKTVTDNLFCKPSCFRLNILEKTQEKTITHYKFFFQQLPGSLKHEIQSTCPSI